MLSLNGAAGCGGNFGGAGCLVVVVLAYWVMLELCNDRPSCAVLANPDTFTEDPCRGTSKYLETHYKCRPNQSDKHTVCEGEEMQIWCGEGDRIAVFTAMYGYVSNGTGRCAPNKQGHIECVAKEAISQVRYHCHGKKRCAIMANSSVFGEPCHRGINKYLTVTYACVPKRILKPLSIKSGSSSSKKKRKKKKQKKKRKKKKKKKNKHKHDNKDRDEEDDDRLLPDLLPSPDEYPPESTLDTVYGTLEGGEVTTYTSGKAPGTSTGNLALPGGTSSSSSTTTHKPSPSSTRASADPTTTQHDDISLSTPPSLSSWSSSPSSSSPSTTTTTTITTTTSTTTHRHHHRHGIDKFNNKNKNIQTEAPSTSSTSKVDDETKRFLDESTIEPSIKNNRLQTSSPDPSSGDSSVVPDTDTLNINSEHDDQTELSTQNIPPQTSPDSGLEYSSVVPDNIILNNQNDGENGSFSSSPEGEEEAGKITTVPNSILDIITKGVQGDEETSPEQIRLGEGVSEETVDVVRTSREGEKDGVLKADNLTLNRGTSGDSSEDRDKSSSDSINNNDNNNSDDNNNDNIGRVKGNSESEPNEMTSRPVGSGNDKNNNDNNSNNKNKQDSSSVDSKKNVHSYGDNGHAGGTDDVSGRGDKKDKDPVSMSERNATTICKNVTKENKNNNDNSFSNSPDSKNKVHSNGNGGKSKPKNKKNGSVLVSERNIAVICKNVSTSWGRDKPLDSRTIGFLKDWFSNIHFLEAHEEKAWLYFTLGICFGIIVILVVVLVKTCFNYRRNIRARLDVSEPTHRSANTNNHSSAMDTPMLEHSDSIDRIEVVRFSPRGTLRSMRSGSHNRDIVNYYG